MLAGGFARTGYRRAATCSWARRCGSERSIERNYAPLILALRDLPIPVVPAVNGVAAGSGANLALACDIVVAVRSASFVQSFTRIGLISDAGGTWWLLRLIRPARARGLALLGEPLSAERAEQWGLIWRCVDDDKLDLVVGEVVNRLKTAAPMSLLRTRQVLAGSWTRSLEQNFIAEARAQQELGFSDDYAEGVAAFLAKRAPQFRGK